jgi:hypothetical protein
MTNAERLQHSKALAALLSSDAFKNLVSMKAEQEKITQASNIKAAFAELVYIQIMRNSFMFGSLSELPTIPAYES